MREPDAVLKWICMEEAFLPFQMGRTTTENIETEIEMDKALTFGQITGVAG